MCSFSASPLPMPSVNLPPVSSAEVAAAWATIAGWVLISGHVTAVVTGRLVHQLGGCVLFGRKKVAVSGHGIRATRAWPRYSRPCSGPVSPAARPLAASRSAILRDASSIISFPNMTAPRWSPAARE
jgi:hypothetical protein